MHLRHPHATSLFVVTLAAATPAINSALESIPLSFHSVGNPTHSNTSKIGICWSEKQRFLFLKQFDGSSLLSRLLSQVGEIIAPVTALKVETIRNCFTE